MKHRLRALTLALLVLPLAPAAAQSADPQAIAAEREAMARFSWMDGIWRGPATTQSPSGPHSVTQTERIGPMLGGDIVVIEGRGYNADGSTGFNAFGIISFDPRAQKYELRSYAQGQAGTFELKLTDDGGVWEVPAGPDAIIRFTTTVRDRRWREVGEYIARGKPPVQTFEMNLTRVGDTDWPLTSPISPGVAPAAR